MRKVKSKGRKPTSVTTNKPLLSELYKCGYNRETICKHLELSKSTWLKYFSSPVLFTLHHYIQISYLLNKPLSYVINLGLNYKPNSVQWVNESVNHINLDKTH